MKIGDWISRHRERKFIKEAFSTVMLLWPHISQKQADQLILHLTTLLVEYENKYGKDDIYLHYWREIEFYKCLRG